MPSFHAYWSINALCVFLNTNESILLESLGEFVAQMFVIAVATVTKAGLVEKLFLVHFHQLEKPINYKWGQKA